jgi:hypothetical protein
MKAKAIYSSLAIVDLHIMQEIGRFCMYCRKRNATHISTLTLAGAYILMWH